MARIKLAYIGGGSTRGPGTMASLIDQGENFNGSEIVLIDLNTERLLLVKQLAEKMVRARGLDIRISATTERRAGLVDCNAVLTSYRPGGFEARALDERIPLKHGVIGQETQGPGGFFMALRSIHVMQGIVADMEAVCPHAILFNYTNPVNIVLEAVAQHSAIRAYSFCEGPLIFARSLLRLAELDPDKVETRMVGLNHGCWSVRQQYDGEDIMPRLVATYEQKRHDPTIAKSTLRLLELAVTMNALPAHYFQYYYFKDAILAELQAKPTTRAEDIMAATPDYWAHYREQAASDHPQLDPKRSRGGVHELELAIDAMDAIFNDRNEVLPVNLPNHGALADFPDDLVVEVFAQFNRTGATRLAQERLPRQVLGLVKMLGEYQALTAETAWSGTRREAIQALASNPLCFSLQKAETIYDEMAAAHRAYLPERLLR
ncbi:MAG: glycoside hydrolase [Caldilinea sp. CFX5]|nr:glycoside hydrolase [Caldilinea sp. CFX5]